MEIWKNIVTHLERGQKVILLLVVTHHGSSPGKQGFKMIVAEDGTLYGSIGGGRTEFNLVEEAKNLLKEKPFKAFFRKQVHRENDSDSSGMICAGEQLVLFYPMLSKHIPTLKRIIKDNNAILSISEDKFDLEKISSPDKDISFKQTDSLRWVYREKVNRKSYVYLIGGGHVGLATAKLLDTLDFEVTMFDERANLNTFEANSFSATKRIIDYKEIDQHIPSNDNTYIVILTHAFETDSLIFSKLLDKDYKYIGLLGSKAKIKAMFKKMLENGCDKNLLQKADAPIGIDIHSKTPAEIAVSIAAKIIMIKNG